jgi:tRNA(Ile)-lysidine synthase
MRDGRSGKSQAILALRLALRTLFAELDAGSKIAVAVSGGADSMALAAAAVAECKPAALELEAIIIDHQLQRGSNEVAQRTSEKLQKLGIDHVTIRNVVVNIDDGIEASARRARYEAFEEFARTQSLDYILLGHTRDDQAEGVLLGLARGSGSRSLSGMREKNGIYLRPLLGISREETEQACRELDIEFWKDPHNEDKKFLRVRAREAISLLEESIGPGIRDALARSADLLRDDADALDQYSQEIFTSLDPHSLDISQLAPLPRAVRTRVLRLAIYATGSPAGSLTADHIAPVEALISNWHGQGQIALPGGVKAERISGRLSLSRQG